MYNIKPLRPAINHRAELTVKPKGLDTQTRRFSPVYRASTVHSPLSLAAGVQSEIPHDRVRVTAAILAGGKSSRMGTDKALLNLHGKPLLAHVATRLAGLQPQRTIVIANNSTSYAFLGLPIYPDVIAETGSLGGLYTALHHSDTPYTTVVACDMPFVSAVLLAYMSMLLTSSDYDTVVPRVAGVPQGLCAVYCRQCLPTIEQQIKYKRFKVSDALKQLHVRYVDEPEWQRFDPQGLSLSNLNTPAEMIAAIISVASDKSATSCTYPPYR